jgi:hypothetical protein
MRPAALLVLLLGAGLLAQHALASSSLLPPVPTVTVSVPLPTVPAPTVPAPTVPAPTVPTPTVPAPTVPAPTVPAPTVQAPTVQAPTLTAPTVSTSTPAVKTPGVSVAGQAPTVAGGVSTAGGGTSGGAAGGSTGGGASSGAAAPGGSGSAVSAGNPAVTRLDSSRTWIGASGKKSRRMTTLVFVLRRAGIVTFTVRKVSPTCRTIGRFAVRAHAGLNKVRFVGKVHGRHLGPGTYQLIARGGAGRAVSTIVLVILKGSAPSAVELEAMRSANVCATTAAAASGAAGTASAGSAGGGSLTSSGENRGSTSSKTTASASGADDDSGPGMVLAAAVEKTARVIRPALVALLALSILMLGLGSLPPQTVVGGVRVNNALARHRLEIAGLGAAALIAVAIAFLIA